MAVLEVKYAFGPTSTTVRVGTALEEADGQDEYTFTALLNQHDDVVGCETVYPGQLRLNSSLIRANLPASRLLLLLRPVYLWDLQLAAVEAEALGLSNPKIRSQRCSNGQNSVMFQWEHDGEVYLLWYCLSTRRFRWHNPSFIQRHNAALRERLKVSGQKW